MTPQCSGWIDGRVWIATPGGKPISQGNGFAICAKPVTLGPMKLQLDDVALFTRIAELGTLSAAARERNVSVSQLARAHSRLDSGCDERPSPRKSPGGGPAEDAATRQADGRRW